AEGEEIAAPGGAGIVDEDVEPAMRLPRRRDERRRGVGAPEIERHDRRRAAEPAHRRRRLGERGLVAAGEHEAAPLGREPFGDAAADAAARAGDERNFPAQLQIHLALAAQSAPRLAWEAARGETPA